MPTSSAASRLRGAWGARSGQAHVAQRPGGLLLLFRPYLPCGFLPRLLKPQAWLCCWDHNRVALARTCWRSQGLPQVPVTSHWPLCSPPPRSPVFPAPPGPSSCSCAVLIGMTPHLLPGAAGTKNLRLGSSNHRNLFSPSPGGQNCERKVSAGLVPSEAYWGHCPRALSSLWALPTVSGSSALASTRSLPSSSQRSPCVCMCWCPDVSS